jgi:peptidyl-prolyl cis-trans isomerase D
MFDLVTKYKRVIQVFLGLIALTFATWGIESYTQFRGQRDELATVNGISITQREFDSELRQQQDRMRQMFGGRVDPAMLDTPETRQALLDNMINQRLVASAAVKSDLMVSDEVLHDTIVSIPAFQSDGQFSKATYEQMLRVQNPPMTPAQFESRLRYDLSLGQLSRAVGDTAIVPKSVANRLAAIELQKREVAEVPFRAEQYLSQVKIDDAKLKAHYDANAAEYRTPERLRAEYVMLSADQLVKQDPPTEAEIKAAYDARAAQFKVDEQRRASHILVKTKEEAEKLSAELKKSPGRFAELAKKHSQDPGSAEKGGDLGLFGSGMMVKPFEDAAFAMKEGEISGPVQSEFGFHVIRVTGIQAGKSRPYEEVRKELATEVGRQKGQRKFAEVAEAFSNLVYEQPDSLKPAADKFNLPVQTSGWVSKSAKQELGALDNPKLLGALFSSDSIKNKRNTDAIEVAPNTLVAARVVEHQPAAQRSFEEVKAQIADTLRRREAAELAQKDGAAKLEALRKGQDADVKWSETRAVSRREAQGAPAEILRLVMSADTSKLPTYVGMPIPDAGYLLLRVSKVIDSDPKERDPEAEQRIGQLFGSAQYQAYVASLRARGSIDVKKDNAEKK